MMETKVLKFIGRKFGW